MSHGHDPDQVLEIRKRDALRLEQAKLPAIPGIPDPSKAAGAGAGGKQPAAVSPQSSAPDAETARSLPADPGLPPAPDYQEVPAPDIVQHDHYSCGAAQGMTAGKLRNVGPRSLDGWKKALGTDVEKSTSPPAIVAYLSSLGLEIEARQGMTIDDLEAYTRRGWYVILPVQDYGPSLPGKAKFAYGHYLGVVKVDSQYVRCQDSSEDNVTRVPARRRPRAASRSHGTRLTRSGTIATRPATSTNTTASRSVSSGPRKRSEIRPALVFSLLFSRSWKRVAGVAAEAT